MKAVALTRYLPISDPASLVDVTLPDPVPTGHDLLVRVAAVSVNPVDTNQRAPSAKVEAQPRVLGWDAAGTVAWVKELGADHVVDHSQPLRPQIEALGLKFVDYIANFNDTDRYWDAMGDLVAPQGAVCMIVGSKGPLAQDAVRGKSATVCWELMFTRPRFTTPDMIEQHRLLTRVAELIDAKRIRGMLRETLRPINAANLRAAHAKLESGRTIGKLVVAGWI
jgi:NADPH:quinone reductase-like Zn-dependent oxidoreductase